MAKFDLKKAILENKATFFGSLNEGQFSWMTQDTGQQIGSEEENTIPVYMFDDKGNFYYEPNYDGYGEFGGMDYYELLDKMNGGRGDRARGIDLAFGSEKVASRVLFPALVTQPDMFNYKTHDFTKEAKHDPNQSWYAGKEDEDEDIYGDGSPEYMGEGFQGQFYAPEYLEQKYGKEMASKIEAEIDEMDENSYDRFTGMESAEEVEDYIADIKDMMGLNEGKIEEKYNTYTHKIAEKFADYMSEKEGRDFTVTMNSVDEYSFDLDLDGEPYEGGSYLLKGGDIINAAVPGNPVYAKVNQFLEEGYDEFKRADKGSKDVTAKNKGEEEVYGAGVKKGEEIEKKKMKMSEFKAKIKEMVLAEMNLDVTDETSGYDFLAEIEGMLNEEEEDFSIKLLVPTVYFNPETGELAETPAAFGADSELEDMGITNYSDGDELSEWVFDNDIEKAKYFEKEYPGLFKVEDVMNEAKDEEIADEEIEVTDEFSTEQPQGPGKIDVTQNANADLTGDKKDVQDNLEAALEAAKALGDDKLATQIGNSLTFFTKQHVVKEDLNEEKGLKGDIVVYKDKNNKKIESKIVKVDVDENDPFSTYELENGDFVNVKDVIKINKVVKEEETLNESMFPMLKKILK
jgi:signal peptidase I